MTGILKTLREDHRNMGRLLDVLESQIEVFRRGDEPDYDILTETVDYCLNYPERFHHPLEDQIFRRIAEKDPSRLEGIGDLETVHAELFALTQRVADAINAILKEGEVDRQAVVNVTDAFIRAYRQHIEAEESDFFPLAERLLGESDWQAIEVALLNHSDPLFGEESAADYRRLRENVLRWSSAPPTG